LIEAACTLITISHDARRVGEQGWTLTAAAEALSVTGAIEDDLRP